MARNRVIYQSEALFVSDDASQTAANKHEQLQRVQSANYSFNISRQDVNQFGQLSRIDSLVLEAPTVSVDFSYYLGGGFNEAALGFFTGDLTKGFASGHMTASSGKNLFITTADEGSDAKDNKTEGGTQPVIGIGNAYLSDYTVDGSVGSLPTVSVSMEAANIASTVVASGDSNGYSGVINPAVDQSDGSKKTAAISLPSANTGQGSITALRPGDITVSFGTAASDAEDGPIVDISGDADGTHIQSVSINLGLSRSPLERLGSRFPFARTVDFPVQATMNVSAIINEITTANLADMLDSANLFDLTVDFNKAGTSDKACTFKLANATLDSESISSSIGSNKTVDLTFTCSIGGPEDATNNIFFSGSDSHVPFA